MSVTLTAFEFQQLEMRRSRQTHDRARIEANDAVQLNEPPSKQITIFFLGQIMGGKNNMVVTRAGLHFPQPAWAKWRNQKVADIRAQLPPSFKLITTPSNVELQYYAGDKRRRDMPAVIDSIFHCLEKAGVVADDGLLWVTRSSRSYDGEYPRAIVILTPQL